jgi:carbon storage regulator
MLYLVRKLNESIIVNSNIEIKVVEIKNNCVKIGVVFPPSATVYRKELHEKIKQESSSTSGSNAVCIDDLGSKEKME